MNNVTCAEFKLNISLPVHAPYLPMHSGSCHRQKVKQFLRRCSAGPKKQNGRKKKERKELFSPSQPPCKCRCCFQRWNHRRTFTSKTGSLNSKNCLERKECRREPKVCPEDIPIAPQFLARPLSKLCKGPRNRPFLKAIKMFTHAFISL